MHRECQFFLGPSVKLPRRTFLHLAAGAAALPVLPRVASALDYPTRPVHILVGFPPGGGTDLTARLIGQWLSERLGQPFVIENRPGAATTIAIGTVAKASGDGYTLVMIGTSAAISATLYENLNFNLITDIAPIANIYRVPYIMEVNPSVPAKTVPEFIAYAKANPNKISMASAGNGSVQHVAGELFKLMTGVNMIHVPYRGSAPALTDLLGGQVQVMFDSITSSIEYVRAGNLRPLAMTSAARSELLPDIATVSEFVPGYEVSAMQGLGAPKNTPTEIIDILNREINAALANPKMKARLTDQGGTVLALSPVEYAKVITDETEKWAKVIKFANIKPE